MGSTKGCEILTEVQSYIEVFDRHFFSFQEYQSAEIVEEAGIKRDFYRRRSDTFRIAAVAGISCHYYDDDDAWGVKITLHNSDYLLYIVSTQSIAESIESQLINSIFPSIHGNEKA